MNTKLFLLTFLCVFSGRVCAQDNWNFIKKGVPLDSVKSREDFNGLSPERKIETTFLLDAFGRVAQQIQWNAGNMGREVISAYSFDQFGRNNKAYLPYAKALSSTDGYQPNWETDLLSFYQNGDKVAHTLYPFSEVHFQNSPFNVPAANSNFGEAWQFNSGHFAKNLIRVNRNYDNVLVLKPTSSSDEIEIGYNSDEQQTLNWVAIDNVNFDNASHGSWMYDDISVTQLYPLDNVLLLRPANAHIIGHGGLDPAKSYKLSFDYLISVGSGRVCEIKVYNAQNQLVSYASTSQDLNTWWSNCSIEFQGGTRMELVTVGPSGSNNDYIAVNNLVLYTRQDSFNPRYFADGALMVYSSTDENGFETISFKNFLGQEVLSRVVQQNGNHLDTYFIYDSKNRLKLTFPPLTIELLGENEAFDSHLWRDLVFINNYDGKNRVVEQKVPGKDWVSNVYDHLDRLIMQQDGNLKSQNQWMCKKYDALGREILNGLVNVGTSDNRSTLQAQYDSWYAESNFTLSESRTSSVLGYSENCFPSPLFSVDPQTVNYFDNYDFIIPAELSPSDEDLLRAQTSSLVTGSMTKILDGSNSYLTSVNYYNWLGQIIETRSQSVAGFDVFSSEYSFTNKVLTSSHQQTFLGETLNTKMRMTYDHMDRPVKTFMKVGEDPEITLSYLIYNDLGQVVKKKLHFDATANNYLQTIDYRYNERGWLSKINNSALVDDGDNLEDDDVFGEELRYDQVLQNHKFTGTAQYNGNIAAIIWKTKAPNIDGVSISPHSYSFEYDGFNRLLESHYASSALSNPNYFNQFEGDFNEKASYDANGNILTMRRINGGTEIDNLSYSYVVGTNVIRRIDEQCTFASLLEFKHFPPQEASDPSEAHYLYDQNGNMVRDENKSISIGYNYLNLMNDVQSDDYDDIRFVYDSQGRKLYKQIGEGAKYYYVNGVEYAGESLVQISTPEGCVRRKSEHATNTTEFVFDYFIKDHLQNVRAIISNENAAHEEMLVTYETVRSAIEEEEFENVDIVRKDKPLLMPSELSYGPSTKTGELTTNGGRSMGPAKIFKVRQGDVIDASTFYWFDDVEPNNSLQSLSAILADMILGITSVGQNIIPSGEYGLDVFQNSNTSPYMQLESFVLGSFNDVDLTKPQAYMVWVKFDRNLKLEPSQSGKLQVTTSNSLEVLEKMQTTMQQDGYFYAYLLNGSSKRVQFDNFRIFRQTASVLEFMDYYPFGLQWHKPGSFIKDLNYTNNKYWHTTKEMQTDEWDNVHGLDLEDFGARMYDPIVARWWSVDSRAQELYLWSPYCFTLDNPIRVVDLDGNIPTPYEAALMSAHVYGGFGNDKLINGWQVSQTNFNITKSDSRYGFKSQVYERVVDDVVVEYAYATAGTQDWRDWITNGKQPLGLSEQYEISAKNEEKLEGLLSNEELTFIGHSLGGGLAALNYMLASETHNGKLWGITFNAAGVGDVTEFFDRGWLYSLFSEPNYGGVTAYINIYDPLNFVQNGDSNIGKLMPDVNGNRNYLTIDCGGIGCHGIDNFEKYFRNLNK